MTSFPFVRWDKDKKNVLEESGTTEAVGARTTLRDGRRMYPRFLCLFPLWKVPVFEPFPVEEERKKRGLGIKIKSEKRGGR